MQLKADSIFMFEQNRTYGTCLDTVLVIVFILVANFLLKSICNRCISLFLVIATITECASLCSHTVNIIVNIFYSAFAKRCFVTFLTFKKRF